MELLEILIITLITTLLIITLGNVKRQNDQIIIFLVLLAGLMIINLCKKEHFRLQNPKILELLNILSGFPDNPAIIAPTIITDEIAFVTDIRGVCSDGVTLQTT